LKIGYPTPVKSAYPLLPKAFIEDPSIFPSREVIESGYWQDDVGEANELYEEYYQKLKNHYQ
jgi:spermidine/putrescine transport system substrate-binding protein